MGLQYVLEAEFMWFGDGLDIDWGGVKEKEV